MPRTPTDVALTVLDGVQRLIGGDASQVERLVALYAEQTYVVHPMSPGPMPALRTREDLRRHFGTAHEQAGADSLEAVDVTVHVTSDPEVVVTEFAYRHLKGAEEHRIPCVFVQRVRDGLVVESHDYADHAAMARAANRPG